MISLRVYFLTYSLIFSLFSNLLLTSLLLPHLLLFFGINSVQPREEIGNNNKTNSRKLLSKQSYANIVVKDGKVVANVTLPQSQSQPQSHQSYHNLSNHHSHYNNYLDHINHHNNQQIKLILT